NQAVVSANTAIDSANLIGLIHTLAPWTMRSSKSQATAIGRMRASSSTPNEARRGCRARSSPTARAATLRIDGVVDLEGTDEADEAAEADEAGRSGGAGACSGLSVVFMASRLLRWRLRGGERPAMPPAVRRMRAARRGRTGRWPAGPGGSAGAACR